MVFTISLLPFPSSIRFHSIPAIQTLFKRTSAPSLHTTTTTTYSYHSSALMAASNKIISSLVVLLCFATFATACDPCKLKPSTPPTPKFPPKGPPANPFCPRDTLKLGACADLLGGVANLVVGTPPSEKCCSVLEGLADMEAAVCLCTAIKANVLGINLDWSVSLSFLISTCNKSIPPGFQCG